MECSTQHEHITAKLTGITKHVSHYYLCSSSTTFLDHLQETRPKKPRSGGKNPVVVTLISHVHNERTVPIIMAGCIAHARNGRIPLPV